jgi:hypothetical protein
MLSPSTTIGDGHQKVSDVSDRTDVTRVVVALFFACLFGISLGELIAGGSDWTILRWIAWLTGHRSHFVLRGDADIVTKVSITVGFGVAALVILFYNPKQSNP